MPLPKPTKGEKKSDFVSRCMSNTKMKSEYPDTDQRLAVCNQQFKANKSGDSPKHLSKSQFFSIQASIDAGAIRRETYQGSEHLVVPMVILVEGVLWPANADGPELALADEFGRFPAGWNGRPVVLGHPVIEGTPVSANSPGVLEEYAFGFLFNTRLKNSKLLTEAWINLDRTNDLGGDFVSAVERLENSEELVEVSTGLFSMNEDSQGDYNGESYTAIWRNIVPDHLAILPEGVKGACSVEDGCGAPRVSGATSYPGARKGPGVFLDSNAKFKGPIMRHSQCTCTDKQKCSKCQQLETNNGTEGADTESQEGIFHSLMKRFGNLLSFRSNQNELSDRDTRTALELALQADNPDAYFYVIAVFDDFFVYEEGFDYTLLRRGYTIGENGAILLGDEKVTVRPVTTFVPLETSTPGNEPTMSETAEEANMNKTEIVEALISNEGAPFDEGDKEFLTNMDDTKLSSLAAKYSEEGQASDEGASGESVTKTETTETTATGEGTEVSANSAPKQPATLEEYINSAPPEMREVLKASHSLHQQRRTEMIQQIKSNERNKFSDNELNNMPMETLEGLAAFAGTADFSLQGAGSLRDQASGDDAVVPEPPKLFAINNEAS